MGGKRKREKREEGDWGGGGKVKEWGERVFIKIMSRISKDEVGKQMHLVAEKSVFDFTKTSSDIL